MKYYILTETHDLTKQINKVEAERVRVKAAWDVIEKYYETSIVSHSGIPIGLLDPNDKCAEEYNADLGFYAPQPHSPLSKELKALPVYPPSSLSLVVHDTFTCSEAVFVATKTKLTEAADCVEITETLYYDAKSEVVGSKVRRTLTCKECGNKMITAGDKTCYKCGVTL